MTSNDDARIDPAAVAALYVEHADELRAFLVGVLRNPELAGEVLQTTFAKALELGHTSRAETRKGWLFKVAFNEAMFVRRRHKVHRKSIHRLAWSRPREEAPPEEHLTRWESVQQVRVALETLPPEQRTVVHLRIYEEKKFAEIAEELGLPLGTVLTRMRLAMKKLKSSLHTKDQADE